MLGKMNQALICACACWGGGELSEAWGGWKKDRGVEEGKKGGEAGRRSGGAYFSEADAFWPREFFWYASSTALIVEWFLDLRRCSRTQGDEL